MPLNQLVTACVAGWFTFGVAGMLVFNFSKNVAFKRTWFSRWMWTLAVSFWLLSAPLILQPVINLRALAFVALDALLIALIAYLNIRCTRFCDQCGATLFNQNWFQAMNFCPKCGAKL
jgi:hypothetical protein